MLLRDVVRAKARIYDEAWRAVRESRPGHRAFSDSFLWHDFFDLYVEELFKQSQGGVVERHLCIVKAIVGKMVYRRLPMPLIASKAAWDGQQDIINELAGNGYLALFEALAHWKPELGAFNTIANFWIRKRIREGFGREIFGIEGIVSPLYRPKRHVAAFAVGLTMEAEEEGEPDYEINHEESALTVGPKYLQRKVGSGGARFLWRDEGTYANPRLKLPGHINGAASDQAIVEPDVWAVSGFLDFLDEADVAPKGVLTPREHRVFRARFLNKRKATHAELGVRLSCTEGTIRKIKKRAVLKLHKAATDARRANRVRMKQLWRQLNKRHWTTPSLEAGIAYCEPIEWS